MTQDNKIWHDYDINNMPDPRREILAYNGKHHNVTIIDREDWEQGFCEWIKHWAYLDDLIASSKALDVAIERIRKWNGAFADKPQYGAFALEFKQALQEINEIMKGGK